MQLGRVSPRRRKTVAENSHFLFEQLFFRERKLLIVFPKKIFRDSRFDITNIFQKLRVIDDDNLKVLHVVSCWCPSCRLDNLPEIPLVYLPAGIEGNPCGLSFLDDLQDVLIQ